MSFGKPRHPDKQPHRIIDNVFYLLFVFLTVGVFQGIEKSLARNCHFRNVVVHLASGS